MIKNIIKKINDEIKKNETYLTELDRAIGDADHGHNVSLGFQEFIKKIDHLNDNCQEVIKELGMTLLQKIGGASGPLYGMSFVKGSKEFSNTKNKYDFFEFKNFVNSFTLSIIELGRAKTKDKTMLDVWWPLNEKLKKMNKKMVDSLLIEIKNWTKATIPLQALRGRASYLGKRSIGHEDPGAASSFIILNHLIKGIST